MKDDNKEQESDPQVGLESNRFMQVVIQCQLVGKWCGENHKFANMTTFEHHQRKNANNGKKETKKVQHLDDCFATMQRKEQLGADNTWYCNQCKDHVQAIKQIQIFKAPPILILCLQRFKAHNVWFDQKNEDKVIYPIQNFDMSQYVLSEQQKEQCNLTYDLYAVSHHSGSLSFGHYTATCLNPLENKWYDYNDSYVSMATEDDIVNSSAYVLYYRRRDFYPDNEVDYKAIKQISKFVEPQMPIAPTVKQEEVKQTDDELAAAGNHSDHNMSCEMVELDKDEGNDGYVMINQQKNGLGFVDDSDSVED